MKISDDTIKKINLIAPETLLAHGVIKLVEGKTNEYVCPFCENGEHKDATGIKPKISLSHIGWKCQRCGEKFDNLKIFAKHYELDDKTNFVELVEKICANFNLPVLSDAPLAPQKKSDVKPAELNLINADLQTDPQALKNFVEKCGGAWRGLPIEILEKFGCRYIENWTPPSVRAAGKILTPTPRVIIPANADGLHSNYLARLTIPKDSFDETIRQSVIEKAHAGKKTLFNPDALTANEPIFVVEGEIDAMSIELAGFKAVALSGVNEYKSFVKEVKPLKKKPFVIILFDPDPTGRKFSPTFQKALADVGCPAVVRFLSETDSKLDANQILQENGADYLMNELFTLTTDAQKEFETRRAEKNSQEKSSTKSSEKSSEKNSLSKKAEKPAAMKLTFEQKRFLYSGDFSDLDFGRRIHFVYGDRIRYLQDENSWLILVRNNQGGGVWKNRGEKKAVIEPFALELADALIANAIPEPEEPKCETAQDGRIIRAPSREEQDKYNKLKKLRDYQIGLGEHLKKQRNISNASEIMKGIMPMIIHPEDLNKPKHLLNCLNGVIDLEKGELIPLDPDYLIMNQMGAAFDPNADTTFIEKFLSEILPDPDTRRAVLRFLGYCLTGMKNYHISEFWQGKGANGKSTFIDLLLKLFGSYAVKLPANSLLESRKPTDGNSATPAIAQLDGDIRLALIDELPRNARFDGALYKTLVGDEFVYSRALYCNPRLIELRAKFIINGNHLPTFDVDDDGMIRRINKVPYNQIFKGNKADEQLAKKLSTPENLSALLKILVAEAVNFYRDGLLESDEMKASKAEYLNENDFVRNFISENCVIENGAEITRKAFEEKILDEYPRECARLKRKELLEQVITRLEPLGAVYTHNRRKCNIFKNIRWINSEE